MTPEWKKVPYREVQEMRFYFGRAMATWRIEAGIYPGIKASLVEDMYMAYADWLDDRKDGLGVTFESIVSKGMFQKLFKENFPEFRVKWSNGTKPRDRIIFTSFMVKPSRSGGYKTHYEICPTCTFLRRPRYRVPAPTADELKAQMKDAPNEPEEVMTPYPDMPPIDVLKQDLVNTGVVEDFDLYETFARFKKIRIRAKAQQEKTKRFRRERSAP